MDSKKILIADDSNIIRSIAKKMIGERYTILEAQDGTEAIKVAQENVDSLIGLLLDLNMPNVNGFEVLKYFKENSLFSKIPVVIITGDDSKETIMDAFNYPIIDVLAKPFNESDINRVLNNMTMNSSNNK
jgi:putative two-component system response regulator